MEQGSPPSCSNEVADHGDRPTERVRNETGAEYVSRDETFDLGKLVFKGGGLCAIGAGDKTRVTAVSYTHLRAHET
mgnify:CR=1 FL=1